MLKKLKIFFLVLLLGCSSVGFSSRNFLGNAEGNVEYKDDSLHKAVAFINSAPETLYTTVEKAIEVANSKTTEEVVWVLPETNPTITRNITINKNVTLNISYNTTNSYILGLTIDQGSTFATANPANLKNTIKIANGITLTNNGTLNIVGEIGGGGGGKDASGQTVGSYTKIVLQKDASIVSNGNLNVSGYIENEDDNNCGSSSITVNNGLLQIPFILRDFRGGSATSALTLNNGLLLHESPFNQFEIRNISTLTRINYNGKVKGVANFFMTTVASTQFFIIGNTAECLIQFNKENFSYLISKYNSSNEIMKIEAYGGAIINEINLSISGKTYNTGNCFLPLSFRHVAELKKDINQKENASFIFPKYYKMLPGCEIKIDQNVDVKINRLIVHSTTTTIPCLGKPYPAKTAAKLINNGNLECDYLGGQVETEISGAILKVNYSSMVSSFEPKSITGKAISTKVETSIKYSEKLRLKLNNSEVYSKCQTGIYTSTVGTNATFWTNADTNTYYNVETNCITEGFKNTEAMTYTIKVGEITSTYTAEDIEIKVPSGTSIVVTKGANASSINFGTEKTDISGTNYVINNNNLLFIVNGTDASEGSGFCLRPDSLIMLDNGSTKRAADLKSTDLIKAFDHVTGKFVARNIIFNVYVEKEEQDLIDLTFANGSILRIATGHGLFNFNRNVYEIYYGKEFINHIGEEFAAVNYKNNNCVIERTKLIDVNIRRGYTEKYSPLSEYDINCVSDGILTIPDDIEGMYDSFKYNENLTFNMEYLSDTINKYGVYTYDDVKDVVPEYVFNVFNFKYWKAFIGKGTLTYDKVNYWIQKYVPDIIAYHNLDCDFSKLKPLGPWN